MGTVTDTDKINNPNPHVKEKKHKKIRPKYERPKPPEEDSDSFEFIVRSAGGEISTETIRITTHCLPTEVKYTLYALRKHHKNLGTQAKVARYLVQTGVKQLEKIPEIQKLWEKGKQIWKEGSEAAKIAHLDSNFRFNKELVGIKTYKFMVPMEDTVAARIANMSSDAGLTLSQGITLALIFGMAQSTEWLEQCREYKKDYKKMAQDQVEEFKRWVKNRLL